MSMTTRVCLTVAPIVVAVLAYFLLPFVIPRYRVNEEGLSAIQVGMTRQQIESILGGPQGDYSGGRRGTFAPKPVDWGGLDYQTWVGDELAITVAFDENEVAIKILRSDVHDRRPPP